MGFLDSNGLTHLWSKIKESFAPKDIIKIDGESVDGTAIQVNSDGVEYEVPTVGDLEKVKDEIVSTDGTITDYTKIKVNATDDSTIVSLATTEDLQQVELKVSENSSKVENFIVTDVDEVTETTKIAIDSGAEEIELATEAELNTKQDILTEEDKQTIADMHSDAVSDVQLNGTSIISNKIANIPMASADKLGTVCYSSGYGIAMDRKGAIYVDKAAESGIDARASYYKPIVPYNLDYAVKAALTDSKRLTTYTDAEKLNACDTIGAQPGIWHYSHTEVTEDGTKILTATIPDEATEIILLTHIVEVSDSGRTASINFYCSSQIENSSYGSGTFMLGIPSASQRYLGLKGHFTKINGSWWRYGPALGRASGTIELLKTLNGTIPYGTDNIDSNTVNIYIGPSATYGMEAGTSFIDIYWR